MHKSKLTVACLVGLLSPLGASALTINATLVQQTTCTPSSLSSACSGTVVATFANPPSGSGTVYAQVVKIVGGSTTNVKCINVRDPSLTARTATVTLPAGYASGQVRINTQVGLNAGNGVSCGQVPVTGFTISSSPIPFTR